MKTIILCGGQGTRLREETEFRPKPLVEIGGRPILWHIMKLYAYYGFRDFVMCLGYRGNMIKEYFLNYQAMNNDFSIDLGKNREVAFLMNHEDNDFRVTLADTGLDSMTGSRIKQVEKYLGDDDLCMVTYGDGISDVNIKALVDFHRSHGKLATVTTVRPPSRFGILNLQDDGNVEKFAEKPQSEGWASAGFFVLSREAFKYLSIDPSCVFERDPLEQLTRDGQLVAYRHDGFFFAMDTYREYIYLNELWNSGNPAWKVWTK